MPPTILDRLKGKLAVFMAYSLLFGDCETSNNDALNDVYLKCDASRAPQTLLAQVSRLLKRMSRLISLPLNLRGRLKS